MIKTRTKKIDYVKSREYRAFKTLTQEVLKNKPYVFQGRFSWLLSPKGEPLELDILFTDMPLAVEIQGIQHSEPSKFFFKKREEWLYYIECDRIKVETCKKYRIPLLLIQPEDPIDAESLRLRVKELIRK